MIFWVAKLLKKALISHIFSTNFSFFLEILIYGNFNVRSSRRYKLQEFIHFIGQNEVCGLMHPNRPPPLRLIKTTF